MDVGNTPGVGTGVSMMSGAGWGLPQLWRRRERWGMVRLCRLVASVREGWRTGAYMSVRMGLADMCVGLAGVCVGEWCT